MAATDSNGVQFVRMTVASAGTLSSVASSATSVLLLAANPNRLGVVVVNESTATLYIKYGATASLTSYTYSIAPGATWEMPTRAYSGQIDAIWSAANGNARVTELT